MLLIKNAWMIDPGTGQEGALAAYDVLSGAVNPAGRLPVTFPEKLEDLAARDKEHPERYAPAGRISEKDAVHPNTANFTEGLLNGYRWFDETGKKPLYPFGFGLSYTEFAYSDMEVQSRENGWQVSCAVQNIGQRDGEEVVQVYLGRPENVPEGVLTAPKVLIDFKRISVKSGETKKVTFMIEEYYTRYFDVKSREYRSFTGSREIMIGASCTDIRLRDLVKGA